MKLKTSLATQEGITWVLAILFLRLFLDVYESHRRVHDQFRDVVAGSPCGGQRKHCALSAHIGWLLCRDFALVGTE